MRLVTGDGRCVYAQGLGLRVLGQRAGPTHT
jgi:hypothetical protein